MARNMDVLEEFSDRGEFGIPQPTHEKNCQVTAFVSSNRESTRLL